MSIQRYANSRTLLILTLLLLGGCTTVTWLGDALEEGFNNLNDTIDDLSPKRGYVEMVDFTSDGALAAVVFDDNRIKVFDVVSGNQVANLGEHWGGDISAHFCPGDRRLVTVCRDNGVRVWDGATGRRLTKLRGLRDTPCCAEFSADGRFLAVGEYNGAVRLWTFGTGDRSRRLTRFSSKVEKVAFSPDGRYLFAAAREGEAALHSTGSRYLRPIDIPQETGLRKAVFSPDSRRYITLHDDGRALHWRVSDSGEGRALREEKGFVDSVTFNAAGDTLACLIEHEFVELWDTDKWEKTAALRPGDRYLEAYLGAVRFSPDGRWLLAVLHARIEDKTKGTSPSPGWVLVIWDTAGGREVAMLDLRSDPFGTGETEVFCARFMPDGQSVAVVSRKGRIGVWRPEALQLRVDTTVR